MKYETEIAMNTIPAQEIKKRGISTVETRLKKGPVHVIVRNQPKYVVMDQRQYEELLEAQEDANLARIRASLADIDAGRTYEFATTAEMMEAIRTFEDEEE
jgi:PHD/YefM family antitoxin component YafN of YafNO toxin-antitoxin module